MGIDLGGLVGAAGDFLRRHTKSSAVRAAEKRRDERRRRRSMEQAKSASAVAGVSAAGTFAYALTVVPVASAAVASGAVAVAALALVQLWRSRGQPARLSREELAALPAGAEDWLLDQRPMLPPEAGPPLDALLGHLGDLPPHLAGTEPSSTLAWEVRRLLGEHLPTLVGAWCALPESARASDREARQRLVSGLAAIAAETQGLCWELARDHRSTLETRSRFLDSRYSDGRLSGR